MRGRPWPGVAYPRLGALRDLVCLRRTLSNQGAAGGYADADGRARRKVGCMLCAVAGSSSWIIRSTTVFKESTSRILRSGTTTASPFPSGEIVANPEASVSSGFLSGLVEGMGEGV